MSNTAKKLDYNFFEPSIELDKALQYVIIHQLQIENPVLFNHLIKIKNESEQVCELIKIIDIGSFVKGKVQMVLDTDYLERRVENMTNDFHSNLNTMKNEVLKLMDVNFDPTQKNSFTNQINDFFQDLSLKIMKQFTEAARELKTSKELISEKIKNSLDPEIKSSYFSKMVEEIGDFEKRINVIFDIKTEGSITNNLKSLLDSNLGKDGNFIKIIENKLSFNNPVSAVNLLQKNIINEIKSLKEEIIAIRSANEVEKKIKDKSIQKGKEFENIVLESLEKYASLNGDLVEDLTEKGGNILNSKKGDFNYIVKSLNKTISIEARNRTSASTPQNIIRDLEATIENRKADYSIYLTANDSQLHKQIGLFQEYDDNKLVTHYGLLEVALKVAISRMKIKSKEIEGIDKVAVEFEINSITESLKSFKSVKSAANNIRKEADKILIESEDIKKIINNSLNNLNQLLSSNE